MASLNLGLVLSKSTPGQTQELADKLNSQSDELQYAMAWNLANLGHLLEMTGRRTDAEKSWQRAVVQFEDLLRDDTSADQSDTLMEVANNLAECAYLAMHDETLTPVSREATALPYARRSLTAFQQAAENKKNDAATVNLAWFRSQFARSRSSFR